MSTPGRSEGIRTRGERVHRALTPDYPFLTDLLYRISDVIAVAVSGLVALKMALPGAAITPLHSMAILLGVLFTDLIFDRWGLYKSWRGRSLIEQVGRLTAAWTLVPATLILVGYALDVDDSLARPWLLAWWLTGWGIMVAVRSGATVALRAVRAKGLNHKRVAVVGAGEWGQTVVRRLNNSLEIGMDIVAVVDDDPATWKTDVDGIVVEGGSERLPALVQERAIDEVWICTPVQSEKGGGLRRVLDLLRNTTVDQRYVPNFTAMRLMNRPMTDILGLPVIDVNVSPMQVGVNRFIKAVEDWTLAVLLLLVFAPFMLLIALGIKLTSRGPVLFKQLRHGWDGKPINVYKFRTMRHHAEAEGTVTQARKDDNRVTVLGAFLRRTSLDELPQFFNVLQGKMSIVGPRPHAIEHNHLYMNQIESYMQRHKVKPGITGWAQVNGLRGETDTLEKMQRRVEHDLYYIENWSVRLDLKIMLLTLFRGFVHPNAY